MGARQRQGSRERGPAMFGAVAALVFCTVLGTALAASTNFNEANTSPESVGSSPRGVAAVDFDGDTDVDLAIANAQSQNVTILRNNGSGNFVQPASSPEAVGGTLGAVVAADFDGDGDQDLVVGRFIANQVVFLRNNGSGNFVPSASSPETTGTTPVSIAAADFDGNADQDLAVVNNGSDDVTILRNNGSGNFVEPASSPEMVGDGPKSVAAADFDGDGDQDLAVAGGNLNRVTILVNDGSANFVEAASSPEQAGNQPVAVVAADLDGDADPDLAVANGGTHTLTFLRNNGSANFVEPASSPEATGIFPNAVAAADFDLDSDTDLATANQVSDDVTILRNTSSGNFVEPASSPEDAVDGPISIAAADLDGDLDPDLAVVEVNTNNVTILRNR